MLDRALTKTPEGSRVFDYGCWGWKVHTLSQKLGLRFQHFGCDIATTDVIPEYAIFRTTDRETSQIPFENDYFDLVVLSHVIEHINDSVVFFQEAVRVFKPNGLIYIEAPSDRSVKCSSHPDVSNHRFYSFWDDPTHTRPWTPASLYRLALSYGCEPLECNYIGTFSDWLLYPFKRMAAFVKGDAFAATELLWKAKKWACYAVIKKPQDILGVPEYRYITLQYTLPGKANALRISKESLHKD